MTLPETLLVATVPASITAVLGYLGALWQHRQKPAEATDAISNGFTRLVDQLQEENARHLERINVLQQDAHRNGNAIMKLKAFGQACLQHIGALERQLEELGAKPITRPVLPDAI